MYLERVVPDFRKMECPVVPRRHKWMDPVDFDRMGWGLSLLPLLCIHIAPVVFLESLKMRNQECHSGKWGENAANISSNRLVRR